MVSRGWRTVNVKEVLLVQIEKVLDTEAAKNEGLINLSQFIDSALKEKLELLKQKHLNHLNMYEDHVKILDSKLEGRGRIVSVYFKRDDGPWCDYCEEPDCVHVQYAWELPEARKVLEGYGLKPPPSKV